MFGDSVVSFADLTAEQQRQLQSNTGFQQERFDLDLERDRDRQDISTESGVLRAGSAGESFYRQQIESGQLTDLNEIERLFGRQGLDDFIDLGRGVEDAQETFDASVLAIETESRDLLTSINANIALLTEGREAGDTNEQADTALAMLQQEAAVSAVETAVLTSAAATIQSESATALMDSAGLQSDASIAMKEAGVALHSAARVQGLFDASEALIDSADALRGVSELFREMVSAQALDLEGGTDALANMPEVSMPQIYDSKLFGDAQMPELIAVDSVSIQAKSVLVNGMVSGQETPTETQPTTPQNPTQPQTIVINNKIQLPSGVIKEIGRTQVELSEQGDYIGV